MASNNIRSIGVGDLTIQSGNGVPDHIAVKGSIYIDMLTAIEYINKDGIAMWVQFLDSTYVFTGGTGGAVSFTGGTYSSGTTILNNSTGGTINITGYTYIPHLEYNNSNSTLWNNGFGNVSSNLSFGENALVSCTTGTFNTSFGSSSLSANTTGTYNTGIGASSLTNNTTGNQNFGIGSFALFRNTTGSFNTGIGVSALQNNTTAGRNIGIGGFTLYNNTGSRNIAIGFFAGSATLGSDNTLMGSNTNNITEGLLSGSNNTIIGTLTSGVINGSNNTIFGKVTGLSSTTTNNIVIADGSGNIRFSDNNVNTILSRLAGSGDRMVIASPNGELSARTITNTTFTGGTVSGATFFNGGLSATTFSATTYLGLPTDIFTVLTVTGITTSSATLTTSYLYYGVNYNGNVDLIAPNPTSNDGFNFNIKDEGGYSGTHRIRITSPIGTIDNNPYVDINLDNMSLHMVARNNNWWII